MHRDAIYGHYLTLVNKCKICTSPLDKHIGPTYKCPEKKRGKNV